MQVDGRARTGGGHGVGWLNMDSFERSKGQKQRTKAVSTLAFDPKRSVVMREYSSKASTQQLQDDRCSFKTVGSSFNLLVVCFFGVRSEQGKRACVCVCVLCCV